MSTPFTAGKMPRLWVLPLLILLPFIGVANEPCTAIIYDFGGSNGNIVPCGPSANTTPQVAINGMGATSFSLQGAPCGALGTGGSPTDALWVTFVIQEGGSFEWQTVPGSDDFYWQLYYSIDPVDTPLEETTTSGCGSLAFADCGQEFTGWKVSSTPDPGKRWRFYLVFYLRNGDMAGNGVIKIRKSCGLACEGQEPAVDIQVDCDNTSYTLTATPGFDNYIWSDATNGVLAVTGNVLTGATQGETYTVVAYNDLGCPGSASVTMPTGGCCEADAGSINGLTQNELLCQGSSTLDAVLFSTSANPQPAGYSYAFFLVDSDGNIESPPGALAGTSTNFSYSSLPAGMYQIYGLSYRNSQPAGSAQAYVNGFSTLGALETDIEGGICAELVLHDFKVTVQGANCGTFPNP